MSKYSLVVVGGGGVGKSAITLSFMRNQFVEEYDPTIEDSYCKQCIIDGQDCTLDITDTAGQEEYRGLWGDRFLRSGEGFLCVYSVIDRNSLQELTVFREQIWRAKDSERVPMIICGNKCDLVNQRKVSEAEGREFSKASNAIFLETSAKEHINVEEAFYELVREIRRNQKGGSQGADSRDAGRAASKKPAASSGAAGCCVLL